jgi:hypothetical protein
MKKTTILILMLLAISSPIVMFCYPPTSQWTTLTPSIFLVLAYILNTPKELIVSTLTRGPIDIKDKSTHIAIWDRTTVDIPDTQYLLENNFEALYFCTATGEQPDLSLILSSSKAKKVNHWEYKTNNPTHLKIYLLFSLYHITQTYEQDVTLHIFTNDDELKNRFKIHANGYLLNNLIFKNN